MVCSLRWVRFVIAWCVRSGEYDLLLHSVFFEVNMICYCMVCLIWRIRFVIVWSIRSPGVCKSWVGVTGARYQDPAKRTTQSRQLCSRFWTRSTSVVSLGTDERKSVLRTCKHIVFTFLVMRKHVQKRENVTLPSKTSHINTFHEIWIFTHLLIAFIFLSNDTKIMQICLQVIWWEHRA